MEQRVLSSIQKRINSSSNKKTDTLTSKLSLQALPWDSTPSMEQIPWSAFSPPARLGEKSTGFNPIPWFNSLTPLQRPILKDNSQTILSTLSKSLTLMFSGLLSPMQLHVFRHKLRSSNSISKLLTLRWHSQETRPSLSQTPRSGTSSMPLPMTSNWFTREISRVKASSIKMITGCLLGLVVSVEKRKISLCACLRPSTVSSLKKPHPGVKL